MSLPAVTVVIVSYNTCVLLGRCLESLEPERAVMDLQIVVVDNGSRDGSPPMVRARFPHVRLIESASNLGFAAANNLVLQDLATPYVLLLNSDTEIQPGLLGALLQCIEDHPDAGAAAPMLVNPDGSLQRSCWRFPSPARAFAEALWITRLLRSRSDYGEWNYQTERRVDFAIGACLLLRRTALEDTGCFDERYFLYAEDADLARRSARAGWHTWFTPRHRVVHVGGASGSTCTSYQFLYAQEQYFAKWYGRFGVVVLRLSQLTSSAARLAGYTIAALLTGRSLMRSRGVKQAAILRWAISRRSLRSRRLKYSR